MGAGPDALAPEIARVLREAEHDVCIESVETTRSFPSENGVGFELMRLVAERVRAALEAGDFPVVLSGNCGVAVGTIAALGAATSGVVWLDAHGELNTPETTRSGFLDGMGLAIATGRCWTTAAREIPGHEPLPDEHLLLVGTRDLDPPEQEMLDRSAITVLSADVLRAADPRAALAPALDALRRRVGRVYLHLDVDVLDARVAPSNEFGSEDGLAVDRVRDIVSLVAGHFTLAAIGVGSYDPAADEDRRTPAIIAEIIGVGLGAMRTS
jgi:arginase